MTKDHDNDTHPRGSRLNPGRPPTVPADHARIAAGDRAREPDGLDERAELLLHGIGEPIDVLVHSVELRSGILELG